MMQHEFSVNAADGHEIPVIHFKNRASSLLIMSHGITTEKTEEGIYTQFAETVLPPEFDAVSFDFRGHGQSRMSSLEMTVAGEILDLMAIFKWAKNQDYRAICHLGTSFGASITLLALSAYDLTFLTSVVFWNPVVNYRNTFINAKVEWAQEFFDQKEIDELAYRSFTKIPETDFAISPQLTQEFLLMRPEATPWPAKIPLLILHGDHDTLVPFDDAVGYVEANRPQADLIRLHGVDHGFDDKIGEAMQMTKDWLVQKVG